MQKAKIQIACRFSPPTKTLQPYYAHGYRNKLTLDECGSSDILNNN